MDKPVSLLQARGPSTHYSSSMNKARWTESAMMMKLNASANATNGSKVSLTDASSNSSKNGSNKTTNASKCGKGSNASNCSNATKNNESNSLLVLSQKMVGRWNWSRDGSKPDGTVTFHSNG